MSPGKYDVPVLFAITTAAVALSQHVHIFWQTLWHTFTQDRVVVRFAKKMCMVVALVHLSTHYILKYT